MPTYTIPTKTYIDNQDALKMTTSEYLKAIGNINSPLLDMPLKNSLAMKAGVGSATFTRASTATYIDRYGVLKTAAIDEPRFEKEGYLNEGNSTNLLTYSEQFDHASWDKGNITIVANTTETLDPYGTNLAEKFSETAVVSDHPIYKTYYFVAGTSYTQSIFAKVGTRTRIELNFQNLSFTVSQRVGFDLVAKTGQVISGTPTYRIEELANGWFRLSITAIATITATSGCVFGMLNDSGAISYLGDITKYMYIFGAQLEALPFASSYIPTTSASVTRAADILNVTAGYNVPFFMDDNTFIYDIVLTKRRAGVNTLIFTLTGLDSTYKYRIEQYGESDLVLNYVNGSQYATPNQSYTPYVKVRLAIVVSNGVLTTYKNGVLVSSSSISTTVNTLKKAISIAFGTGAISDCNKIISNFRIYDKALTAQEVALA